jgi:hypothetical protein
MPSFNDLEDFEDCAFSEQFDFDHMFHTTEEISMFRNHRIDVLDKLIHRKLKMIGISTQDQTFLENTISEYNQKIAGYTRNGCRYGRSTHQLQLMLKTQETATRLLTNDELFASYDYDEPTPLADAMIKYEIERDLYIVHHLVRKVNQAKTDDMIRYYNRSKLACVTCLVDGTYLLIIGILLICLTKTNFNKVLVGWILGCIAILLRELGSLFFE